MEGPVSLLLRPTLKCPRTFNHPPAKFTRIRWILIHVHIYIPHWLILVGLLLRLLERWRSLYVRSMPSSYVRRSPRFASWCQRRWCDLRVRLLSYASIGNTVYSLLCKITWFGYCSVKLLTTWSSDRAFIVVLLPPSKAHSVLGFLLSSIPWSFRGSIRWPPNLKSCPALFLSSILSSRRLIQSEAPHALFLKLWSHL